MAPTELGSAEAVVTARALTSSMSLGTKSFAAVAGANSAATTAAAFALTAAATCTAAQATTGSTASGSTTINMASVSGFVVGMVVTGSGRIPAGAKVISIKTSATRNIVISAATSGGAIGNGTTLTGTGCQKYFNVNNIKPVALTSFGISQTVNTTSGNTITLQSCSGTWTEAIGNCSGTIANIITTATGSSAVTNVPIPLVATTGTVRMRALYTVGSVKTTISVAVRRINDVAAGVTTNS